MIVTLAPVGMVHDETARFTQQRVIGVERRADGRTAIPRRRLDVKLFERRLLEYAPIGDAVERYAAGHTQTPLAGLPLQRFGHLEQNLLCDGLDAGGDIGVVLVALA